MGSDIRDRRHNTILQNEYRAQEGIIESKKCSPKYPPMKFLDMSFFRESYDGTADDEIEDE